MKPVRATLALIAPLTVGLVALLIGGCSEEPTRRIIRQSVPDAEAIVPTGYAGPIEGTFTYPGEPPAPEETTSLAPDNKDYEACHPGGAKVLGAGWYVNKENKGVQMLVVYLKAAGDAEIQIDDQRMKLPPDLKPLEQIGQPRCQFKPRVTLLHPKQNIKVVNDSDPPVTHDAKFVGPRNHNFQMLAKVEKEVEIGEDDGSPTKISCGAHGMMSGYVWKFTHPFAARTNDDGKFKIPYAPILPDGTKLELWIWHEKLSHRKIMDLTGLEEGKAKDLKKLDVPTQ